MDLVNLRFYLDHKGAMDKAHQGFRRLRLIMTVMEQMYVRLDECNDYVKNGYENNYLDGESCDDMAQNIVAEMLRTIDDPEHEFGPGTIVEAFCVNGGYEILMEGAKSWKTAADQKKAEFEAMYGPGGEFDGMPPF